ncbi:hypothetical protein G6045_34090 [Streptomyces sp. YC504]|uniref:Uncharacterized protein n=1 Tax=Streptomyces mesophilus TaxID=1775132 RepID=A0A6G4XVL0_9ACTN|nr:hypothetical protein [Streptomyces mesophilus]NGO80651.1 hypothetical protein [Streptomyces mesophilus]
MISEPELVGEDGEIPPYAVDVVAPPDPVRREPGPRRPWLWALGGALVASAVWAGSLYAVRAGAETDLRGYRLPDDLCTTATLASLTVKYGKRTPEHRAVRKDPALDRAWCAVQLGDEGQGAARYVVSLRLALHKKVDPEPEFKTLATQKDWYDESDSAEIKEVTGLGERAFYIPGNSFGAPTLEVLDGPAVLEMSLSPSYDDWEMEEGDEYVEPPDPDFSGVRELMIEDMKVLMQDLKK